MSCYGCECLDDSSNCGKTVIEGNNVSLVNCDSSCEECKDCGKKSYSSQNNNRKELNANSFLKFLKRQQEMNIGNEIPTKNKKKHLELINLPLKNKENKENNIIKNCLGNTEEKCSTENNCYWDNKSIQCNKLEVIFYTIQGLEDSNFKLSVGNYDNQKINNFEFSPKYILIPFGLRVKIWKQEGFVGEVKSFSGNITPGIQDDELINKLMYKINIPIGSIQICNINDCVKPSLYQNLKLINVIDGNNIDSMDRLSVKGVEDYKNRLIQNIKNRLNFIVVQYSDCIDQVKDYLQINNINIDANLNNIDDINTLQRIKYTLYNLPNCNDLNLVNNNDYNNDSNNVMNNEMNNEMNNDSNNETIEAELNNKPQLRNIIIIAVSIVIVLLLIVVLLHYKKML
jgi:hypothetical protein